MSNIEVPGWTIRPDHTGLLVRTFYATPTDPIDVEYVTETVRRGKRGDATYLARVHHVHIRHRWDEERAMWWGSASLSIYLVNPSTGERYRTGWKSETIYPNHAHQGVRNVDEIVQPLAEATDPRTIVTVTEVPA